MVVYNRNSQFELNTLKLSGDAKTVIRFSFYLKIQNIVRLRISAVWNFFGKAIMARYIVHSEIEGNWYILGADFKNSQQLNN